MPVSINDGRIKVWAVEDIADITAPTTTELNAGRSLECDISADDGLQGFTPTTAQIDTSALCTTFDTFKYGRITFSNTGIKFNKRDSADPNITSLVKGTLTHIVVRRDQTASDAWASDDNVEVYPVECATRQEGPTPKNSMHTFVIPMGITDPPDLDAVVA